MLPKVRSSSVGAAWPSPDLNMTPRWGLRRFCLDAGTINMPLLRSYHDDAHHGRACQRIHEKIGCFARTCRELPIRRADTTIVRTDRVPTSGHHCFPVQGARCGHLIFMNSPARRCGAATSGGERFWRYAHRRHTGASPESRRSPSDRQSEGLRRDSGEAPARPAGGAGAGRDQSAASGSVVWGAKLGLDGPLRGGKRANGQSRGTCQRQIP